MRIGYTCKYRNRSGAKLTISFDAYVKHLQAPGREPVVRSPVRISLFLETDLSTSVGICEVQFDHQRAWPPGEERRVKVVLYTDLTGGEVQRLFSRETGNFLLFGWGEGQRFVGYPEGDLKY